MNLFAHTLTITTLIACLSIGACREDRQHEEVSDPKATPPELATSHEPSPLEDEQTSPQEPVSPQQEITDLQREIETSKQTIQGLNAAVDMERAKLDENPDYDQYFLNEVLLEQQQERLEIEKALTRLETLNR